MLAYDTGLPSARTLADAIAPGAGFAGGPGARTGRDLGTVTDGSGRPLGTVIRRSSYRNRLTRSRMTALTVRLADGTVAHGRYGPDSGNAITLRPSRATVAR